jgi:hypothetical protein
MSVAAAGCRQGDRALSRAILLLAALAAFLLTGCGGDEDLPAGASLTVSRDFGTREMGRETWSSVSGGDTVMSLLESSFDVEARPGDGVVEIDGVAGGHRAGRPVDWFYYVNGVEAIDRAAQRPVRAGDRVWWDHHDSGATLRIPAVVGAFPEPFLSGLEGKRIPVRLDCAPGEDATCDEVRRRLEAANVTKVSTGLLGGSAGEAVLRIVVGRWSDIRQDPAVQLMERGPAASGVYARMHRSGRRLALLEADGAPARTLGAGAGLVAATRLAGQQPTWVVTGTDAVGLAAAAAQLEESALRDRFAIAVEEGRAEALPVVPAPESP